MKISSALCVLGVAVLATGCASVAATGRSASGYPTVYAGTRLNLTALQDDDVRLSMYRDSGIKAPSHPEWDLPLSLVADTFTLPLDVWYEVWHPNSHSLSAGQSWLDVLVGESQARSEYRSPSSDGYDGYGGYDGYDGYATP